MDSKRVYIGIALGLLAVHALVVTMLRAPVATSDLILDACVTVACFACYSRSRTCLGTARWKWMLVGAGILVWLVGQTLTTYDEGMLHLEQATTAINSDFYFFLFGIPVLLTISSTNERKGTGAFLWIDGLQAVLAVYLVHLQLFPGGSGASAETAISSLRMTYTYNVENLALAVASTLRLLAKPQGEERGLYRTLVVFLWTYAITAAILNYLSVVEHIPTGTYLDLFWDAPFLLLATLVTCLPRVSEQDHVRDLSWPGLLMTNASPIFFSLGLLVLGVYIARERFVLGVVAIVVALVSYGIRSSLLQTQSMRTEQSLLDSEAALLHANQQLEQLSLRDSLTGTPNRRRFEEALTAEWNRVQRAGGLLSLLVIDIDHFKLLNDRYGHLCGDACLIQTARALEKCLRRSGELVARYGGEEFVAILPAVDHHGALVIAEQIRVAVEELSIANEDAPEKRLTVSIGLADNSGGTALDSSDLFDLADQALYGAKLGGRNRVHAYHSMTQSHAAASPLLLVD